MNQIKKHAIGYNTVSSVDGIINARGVKSKPNDIRISGYTHEVGEGEKSPDNPYTLVSLDSGNVNLYSEDKLSTFIVDSASKAKRKGLSLPTPKSKFYCVHWDNNAKTPIAYKLINKETAEIGTYQWTKKSTLINVPFGYDLLIYDASGNGTTISAFTEKENLMVLDSSMMPDTYISDEHSITLTNNETTIQVPVPITLKSVDGVSDRIVKKDDGYYVEKNIQDIIVNEETSIAMREQQNNHTKFNINIKNGRVISSSKISCNKLKVKSVGKNDFDLEYIRSSTRLYPNLLVAYMLTSRFTTNDTATENEILAYLKDNPMEIQYQVENPYYLKLSDYAQELLNSFTLQNNNKIWIEGYPNLKISGYIQK
jgi:hypothetical protein